jgi:hypothetical protein
MRRWLVCLLVVPGVFIALAQRLIAAPCPNETPASTPESCPCGAVSWECDEYAFECSFGTCSEPFGSSTLPCSWTPSGSGNEACPGGTCCCTVCDPPGDPACVAKFAVLSGGASLSPPGGPAGTATFTELPFSSPCDPVTTVPFSTNCSYPCLQWKKSGYCVSAHWNCAECPEPETTEAEPGPVPWWKTKPSP